MASRVKCFNLLINFPSSWGIASKNANLGKAIKAAKASTRQSIYYYLIYYMIMFTQIFYNRFIKNISTALVIFCNYIHIMCIQTKKVNLFCTPLIVFN